jgi:hypothetical protein
MAKNPISLAPDLRPDRRRSRLLLIAAIFVLVPLVAPLFMEAVSLCYAQWCEILGTPVAVRTPILDSIRERAEDVRQDLRFRLTSYFQRVPWNPNVVLPLIAVVMIIAIWMLRL